MVTEVMEKYRNKEAGQSSLVLAKAPAVIAGRGSRINRFLDTLIFIRNKNIPFCKEQAMKKASFQDY